MKNISEVIKEISKQYCEENNCTLWDINNGLCEDFANDVIFEMGGYNDSIYELAGDMFFNVRDIDYAKENWDNILETEFGIWGIGLLEYWGYPENVDITKVNDELCHTWVFFEGKHYDAECPDGVEKWFDLPLNKKYFDCFVNL